MGLTHIQIKMKSKSLSALLFLSVQFIFCQTDIGAPVEKLIDFLQYRQNDTKQVDPFGRKGISFDYELKWENNIVTNVILHYKNSFIIDLRAISDFDVDFFIRDGQIEEITYTYFQLPEKYIEEKFDKRYGERKVFDFYFTEDYKFFRSVFESNEGYGSIRYSKAEWPYLGKYMLGDIKSLQDEYEKSKNKN